MSESQTRLIRLPEVIHRVGLRRSSIYQMVALGKFPRPIRLGSHSVAWNSQVIDKWIQEKLTASDGGQR